MKHVTKLNNQLRVDDVQKINIQQQLSNEKDHTLD
jgi:hypothetical protein